MSYLFLLFGGFFVCIGIAMLFASQALIGWVRRYAGSWGVYIGAIVFRVILGIVFFGYADVSSFPRTFEVIGLLGIAGAAFVGLMGRENLASFMEWLLDVIPKFFYPIEGLMVIAFGGFIVYAVL